MSNLDLGNALYRQGKYLEAIPLLEAAVQDDPKSAPAMTLLGSSLCSSGKMEEGINFLKRALIFDSLYPQAMAVLGGALIHTGKPLEAHYHLDRCLQIAPGFAKAHWNRAQTNLMLQNWQQGWIDYEWGKTISGCREVRFPFGFVDFNQPSKETDVLLLWCEQGIGDTIQFLRYVKHVEKVWNGRIAIQVQPDLVELVARQFPQHVVIATHETGTVPIEWTHQISLCSLPLALGFTVGPDAKPWMQVEPDPAMKGKVGLCWSGSKTHANDANRSCPIELLKPLKGLADFVRVGGPFAEELPFEMETPVFLSFYETAQVVAGLDLLVTVDTSVAHIAGSLGVRTLLMAPKTGEWRWGYAGRSNPWYQTVEVFRPGMDTGFAPIIDEIAEILRKRNAQE